MKNLLLSFICLMLCAPLGVKAQVYVSSSDQLKNAFTEYGKISQYEADYSEAQELAAELKTQKTNYDLNPETEYTYNADCNQWKNAYNNIKSNIGTATLYFVTKASNDLTDEGWEVFETWFEEHGDEYEGYDDDQIIAAFVALPGNADYAEPAATHVYPVDPKSLLGVSAEPTVLGTTINYSRKYSKLNFVFHYLRYDFAQNVVEDAEEIVGVLSTRTKFGNKVNDLAALQTTEYNNSVRTIEKPNPYTELYNQAVEAVSEAKANLDNANKYKRIIITSAISTDAYIEDFAGDLIGNGYTVSVSNANSALIGTSAGTVSGLCVSGAKIATTNNGTYSNCVAVYNGITGFVGNSGTTYTSLAKLASVMSGTFGLDMTNTNSLLVPVTQNNKVYEVSYYALSSKNIKQTKYLNVRNGSLVGTTKPTLAANEFLIIESENTNTDITEQNVIELASAGYVCNNCYLTDASEFYSPVKFVAAKLNYTRTFSADVWSSLVLPFDANTTVLNKIGVSRVNEFGSFDNGNVTFVAASEIKAYQPYIIKTVSSGAVFANIENAVFEKSPSTDLHNLGSNGYFYGNLSTRQTVPVLSNNGVYRVYGFNSKNQMARGSETAYFSTFRCYLLAKESEFTSSSANSKVRVQFLDKYGDVIDSDATTDVDIVKSNNISVVGGNNEIIVNSDKEQSVSVYTTNGKLVQVADIAEGENVISVNPGMYIVNGKKVIVK